MRKFTSVVRGVSVGVLVVAGMLTGTGAAAQGAAAAAPAPPVSIKLTPIAARFYVLEGQGGAIGVLTGPDGVLMVDAQFAPLTDRIVAAIKTVTDGPIRFLVNTHVHGDHTGGNENLGRMGVTILARENLRTRLMKPNPAANGTPGVPAPPMALPLITYDAPLVLHLNGQDVRLIPVPAAHTDGDTMVHFPAVDVIMTGDFYRSVGFPNIDRANGGSLRGLVEGLNAVIALAGPSTKIVPGHGAIVDRAGVTAHRDMILGVREKVAALVRQGKTQEEVLAAKPTADYDAKVVQGAATVDRFVGQVYAELKSGR